MNPIFIRYTWKTLKENRSRTWVTIVGIALSAALVTAVTVSIASAIHYFERVAVENVGDWCVNLYEADGEEAAQLAGDGRVSRLCALQSVGYAALEDSGRPYLFVAAMGEGFAKQMPVELIEGRMPQNDTELLLSRQFLYNSGLELAPGDLFTLAFGSRAADGRFLGQHDPFCGEDSETPERFVADGRVTAYTVAGIYEEPEFEARSGSCYMALTAASQSAKSEAKPGMASEEKNQDGCGAAYELWIQLKDLSQAETFLREKTEEGYRGELNRTLLKYRGLSGSASMELLYSMGAILTAMVAVGSVALICNAFSISVTERVRQFGLLRSLGATRRQIMGSILAEGLMLCVAGIPLGILTGCLGIGATIWGCSDLFETALGGYSDRVSFEVHITAGALFMAAGMGFLTVFISAWLPARKALRLPALEAIRQNKELRLRPGQMRISPLTRRLFGLEGMLASKNFKRSRRRYQATVFSLFFSIVLFVCANSFCHYLKRSMEDGRGGGTYDLAYYMWDDPEEMEDLYGKLRKLKGVDGSVLLGQTSLYVAVEPKDQTEEFKRYRNAGQAPSWAFFLINFVEDEDYRVFLAELGLDPAAYLDEEHPTALVYDRMVDRFGEGGYQAYDVLKEKTAQLQVILPQYREGYGMGSVQTTEEGEQVFYYREDSEEGMAEPLVEPLSEAARFIDVSVGTRLEHAPWFCSSKEQPQIFLPASVRDAWGLEKGWRAAFFLAEEYDAVYEEMEKLAKKTGGMTSNNARTAMETRALTGLIEVFSTGFLLLISLIATANVFNTISTNILLRRREFAMLRSLGMTKRGIRRILNYECLLYGAKSVAYAAPVSLGLTWLIYENVKRQGAWMKFYIPWQTLAAVGAVVFLVVFSTMLYASGKLGGKELAEEIREENA